jgi:hypothetical protein
MVYSTANRSTAQARTHLMIAINIIAGIIRFDPVHFIITDVQAQRTATTAVYRTGSPYHFIFRGLHGVLYRRSGAFMPKGKESPPAASAREPIAVDLTSIRRLIPP